MHREQNEQLRYGSTALTDDGNRFPRETKSTGDAHVFASTSGRPESEHVLDAEEDQEKDLDPVDVQRQTGGELVNRRENRQNETDEHDQESRSTRGATVSPSRTPFSHLHEEVIEETLETGWPLEKVVEKNLKVRMHRTRAVSRRMRHR